MKLAVSCASPRWGGLEQMAVVLSRGLAHRGHDVVVLCRRDAPVHRRLRDELPCEPVLGGSDVNPVVIARAARALRRHRPDVVLGNMYKDPRWTGVAARLLGIPFVYRQEIDEPYRSGAWYRMIYGLPTRHVVNSAATRRTVLESAPWLAPEKVVIIPNGVDAAAIAAAAPVRLDVPADAVVFGCVGRWERRKGIFELAAAWPRVVEEVAGAHLVVAGWGPEEEAFAAALGGAPHVHWLGMVPDVPAVLTALDVLVAPTHREGFGLAILEGMAAGRAVVSTRTSSVPDLVRDGVDGVLVPVGDAAALADAMVRLGRDASMRRRMGAAGAVRAQVFSLDAMLAAHEALLQELAGTGPRVGRARLRR
jgi:glycosyltransferase involved in cell wall biosynthesis